MSRQKKFMQHARSVAMSATGVKNYRIGCVLVDRNRVVSAGSNSYKTHPLLAQFDPKIFLHAEQDALIRRGLDNLTGLDLYVCRLDAHNCVRMSKPCCNCMKMIEEGGIRNVYYSNTFSNFWKINSASKQLEFKGDF